MDHRILSEYIHIENKSKIMIQGVNKSVVNTYINYTINYSITKKCSVTHKQQHFHLITFGIDCFLGISLINTNAVKSVFIIV